MCALNARGSLPDSDAHGEAIGIVMPDDYVLPYEADRALIRVILAVRGRKLRGGRGVA